jgi:hypothetical protein
MPRAVHRKALRRLREIAEAVRSHLRRHVTLMGAEDQGPGLESASPAQAGLILPWLVRR